jgi:small subunit ribosomal protein S18
MADEENPQAPPPAPEIPAPEAAPAPQAVPATSHQGPPRRREGGPPGRRMGGPGGGGRREGGPGAGPRRGKRQFFRKKKVCKFCVERVDYIDYKKPEVLQTFVQDRGKILPRRITGTCARHQRWLGVALRRARNIALLPFATEL